MTWIDKCTEHHLSARVSGAMEDQGAGGGWSAVLSALKTLLETGSPLLS